MTARHFMERLGNICLLLAENERKWSKSFSCSWCDVSRLHPRRTDKCLHTHSEYQSWSMSSQLWWRKIKRENEWRAEIKLLQVESSNLPISGATLENCLTHPSLRGRWVCHGRKNVKEQHNYLLQSAFYLPLSFSVLWWQEITYHFAKVKINCVCVCVQNN